MLAILRSQLWELGRTIWFEVLYRSALGLVFMTLHYGTTYFGLEFVGIRGAIVMLLLWNAIPSAASANPLATWSNELGGFGYSICLGFTRPISTLQLAIVPVLLSVVVGLVCFLIPASLYFWLLGESFPIAGPSALVAGVVCCWIAIGWSPATAVGRWIVYLLTNGAILALFMFVVFMREHSRMFAIGEPAFWDFPWFIYVGLALVSAIAVAFTVLGVQRRRYGESLWKFFVHPPLRRVEPKRGEVPHARPAPRLDSTLPPRPVPSSAEGRSSGQAEGELSKLASQRLHTKPFRNPWTAQCWYDFQRIRKWLLFPLFLLPIAIVVLVCVANYFDPDVEACLQVFAGSLVLCPIVYQAFGTAAAYGLRTRDGAVSCPVFDATCPMRSDHLIAMKLLLVSGWSLVGWLLMAVGAILYSPYIGDGGTLTKVGESLSASVGEVSAYWWVAAAVSALPLLISTTPVMLAYPYLVCIPSISGYPLLPRNLDGKGSRQSGRRLACFSVVMIAIVHILMIAVDIMGVWSFRYLWIAYSYLLPVVIVGLCLFALKKSLCSGFVGKPYFVIALSMWAVFLCTTVPLAIILLPAIPSWIPLSAYLICSAMLLVPLAATAVAPMALASHRHA